MSKNNLHPFIQTHTFSVEPYLQRVQGYAPFLASSKFTGRERIFFQSLNGDPLPDINRPERQLNEFANGKWFLSDAERVKSATGGSLKSGIYRFLIEDEKNKKSVVDFQYDEYFLQPVEEISIWEKNQDIKISWSKPKSADSFWVFAFREDTKNFLEELLPITDNKYLNKSLTFKKSNVPPGVYRCAVRANRMWKCATFAGFLSESWAISLGKFVVL